MRQYFAPLLASAICLLSLTAVNAETKYQGSVSDAVQKSLASSFEYAISIGDTDDAFALAVPVETSDEPHHQGEEAAESQSPAPANADLNAERHVSHSVGDLCNTLYTSAEDNDLPVPFFANLIWQESELQLHAVSRAGALGIAQFMPEIAVEVGLRDPFDPQQALPASARLLHALRQQFGNLGFVAAAYNAGPHRVADWLDHGRALPQETKTYVLRVTGRSAEAWRKSPLDDSQLTFAKPLPCRHMPAFADLEQAQREQALVEPALEPSQPQSETIAPTHARAATEAKKIAQRMTKTISSKAMQKAEKTSRKAEKVALLTENATAKNEKRLPAGHHVIEEPKVAHSGRNFHSGKHEAIRPQHGPHERRKVA